MSEHGMRAAVARVSVVLPFRFSTNRHLPPRSTSATECVFMLTVRAWSPIVCMIAANALALPTQKEGWKIRSTGCFDS